MLDGARLADVLGDLAGAVHRGEGLGVAVADVVDREVDRSPAFLKLSATSFIASSPFTPYGHCDMTKTSSFFGTSTRHCIVLLHSSSLQPPSSAHDGFQAPIESTR